MPQSPTHPESVPAETPGVETAETSGTGTVETADAPGWVSRHPLLTDTAWADLSGFAPEVTTSITTLMDFSTGLRSFDRPMGPDEALLLIDGTEALSRITEALSTLALSVYERVGTPADTGAKDTKSLIRDRLNLTPTEANRRTELAKNLGGRVDTTGQALQPLCPEVAEGLHTGMLSAGQAKVIDDCLDDLPAWVSAEQRADVEKRLVDYAPQVRVKDLRGIFDRMLAYIDPDGAKPREETPRTDYSVTVRPKRNGDWVLGGLLDPVSGAALNGLLTSRIHSVTPDGTAAGAGVGHSNADADQGDAPLAGEDASKTAPPGAPAHRQTAVVRRGPRCALRYRRSGPPRGPPRCAPADPAGTPRLGARLPPTTPTCSATVTATARVLPLRPESPIRPTPQAAWLPVSRSGSGCVRTAPRSTSPGSGLRRGRGSMNASPP